MRPYQFCNLSEIVVRSDDTVEILLEKAEIATILGTFQSTLTHFPYLRKIWKKNTEEERLLGVSLTGIMDNPIMQGGYGSERLKEVLTQLKQKCVEVNSILSNDLGIQPSASITCVN